MPVIVQFARRLTDQALHCHPPLRNLAHRKLIVSRHIVLTVLLVALPAIAVGDDEFTSEQLEFFEAKVRPLLVQHCYDCHSTDAKKLKGGLYVDSREGLMKGGDSGAAAVTGKPHDSLLIDAVKYKSYEMPPGSKLAEDEIAVLVKWVELGLPWPKVTASAGHSVAETEINWKVAQASHWAWQPVQRPDVPSSQQTDTNPIDAFVEVLRQQAGIEAAPAAAPRILARRIYIDLIGIAPTPPQVADFVSAATRDRVCRKGVRNLY
jgi:mono/diheme cytochrome c family protein